MLARYPEEVCWTDVLRNEIVIDLPWSALTPDTGTSSPYLNKAATTPRIVGVFSIKALQSCLSWVRSDEENVTRDQHGSKPLHDLWAPWKEEEEIAGIEKEGSIDFQAPKIELSLHLGSGKSFVYQKYAGAILKASPSIPEQCLMRSRELLFRIPRTF